jgi:hypothetical protein
MKNNQKNILDVQLHCNYIPNMSESPNRINENVTMTLRPQIRKASKKFKKATGKTLSGLANDLLEEYFKTHGYLPKGAA